MATKLLSTAQAQAVYDAMCSMNNVGGFISAHIQLISVKTIGGRFIVIEDHSTGAREDYDGQHPFAAAYDLG